MKISNPQLTINIKQTRRIEKEDKNVSPKLKSKRKQLKVKKQ